MNTTIYTPEAMELVGLIYDKLDFLPPDKRSIVAMMAEAFINGMSAQERLSAQTGV